MSLLAVAVAAAATLSTSSLPAHASGEPDIHDINPNASTELVIHKFEQPQEFGLPADGLPIADTTGFTAVAGVTYTAKQVPGVDLTTYDGWDVAKSLTLAEAATKVVGQPVAATATTTADGTARLDLGVGLYYVDETSVPAGVVSSDPFLVAMPLQHPTADQWMYTVHIYPKNPRVGIGLTVDDADAVSVGDSVTWTSTSSIPRQTDIDGYVVQNLIAEHLELSDAPDDVQVTLTGNGSVALTPGADYITEIVTVDGRQTVQATFTATGRAKLVAARAADPDAQVQVTYHTRVLNEGSLTNEARLLPDQRAISGQTAPVTAQATTKFGALVIHVHEKDDPQNLIPGATFKVYLSAEDAAADRNPIVVNGTDEWTSDGQGTITISGLRLSNYVDGLDRDTTDALYRYFFVRPTFYPAGWMGDWSVLQTDIISVTDPAVVTVELWRDGANNGGATPPAVPGEEGGLAVTGAQLTGLLLLGLVLVGGGALALIRRRKKKSSDSQLGDSQRGDDSQHE